MIHAKIYLMTSKLPPHIDRLKSPPDHYSYLLHRKQLNTQIILPVILSALALIGLVVLITLSTFKQDGDVGRWAAISTIWIIIPVLIAGLILLLILVGLIYLMARALQGLPYYTELAQDYVYKVRGYIIRGVDAAVKPILALDGWLESIRAFIGRKTP